MKNKLNLVKINSFSGLIIVMFIMTGLFCGFIVSPIWGIMKVWNAFMPNYGVPAINMFQAALLWLFAFISGFLFFSRSVSIKIERGQPVSPSELKKIMTEISEKEVEKEEIRK